MRRRSDIRVVTGIADGKLHAGQFLQMNADAGELLPGQVVGNRGRQVGAALADLPMQAGQIPFGQRKQARQTQEGLFQIVDLFRDDHHLKIGAVGGKFRAIAVQNASPRRGQQFDIDAVLVRHQAVAISLHHLQVIHPCRQGAQKQALAARQHHCPAGKALQPHLFAAPVHVSTATSTPIQDCSATIGQASSGNSTTVSAARTSRACGSIRVS